MKHLLKHFKKQQRVHKTVEEFHLHKCNIETLISFYQDRDHEDLFAFIRDVYLANKINFHSTNSILYYGNNYFIFY